MHLVGIGFAILASLAFAITYTFYKLSLPMISNAALLCVQNSLALLLLTPFVLKKGIASALSTNQIGKIFLRAVFGLGSIYFITLALKTTNLAEVTLLNNIAPLCVPLIASLWLKEKINHKLWPAILLGFVGIALILQPWGDTHFSQGLLFALLSGLFSGCLVIATRQMAHLPFLTLLFYRFLFFTLMTLPFALSFWKQAPPLVWIYVACAAVMLLLSQWSFTAALRHAPSQVVAPFFYLIVVFSMIIDGVLWKQTPSWLTLIGMCAVATGGIIATLISCKKNEDAVVIVEPVSSGAFYKMAAKGKGYRVIGVFQFQNAFYEKRFHLSDKSRLEDCDLVIHSTDVKHILNTLKTCGFNIKGCLAGGEVGVELAEQLCVALNLISNPLGTAHNVRDKGNMRKVLKSSGLSCPDFAICLCLDEAKQFAKHHPFPLVIKTPQGAGTSQVFVLENEKELIARFKEILEKPDPYGKRASCAVIEEYIGGKEFAVDAFSDGQNGYITDVWVYNKVEGDAFQNIYYNVISLPLDDPSIQAIQSYALKVLKAYKIERGPSHIEIKDDPIRGPTLIEIAGRLSGGNVARMVLENSNFDPFKAGIEVFTQQATSLPSPIIFSKHLAICFCPIFQSGVIKKIKGIEQIVTLASYVRHSLNIHIGNTIAPSTDLASIPMSVQLAHADRKQLLKDMQATHALFQIET